MTAPRNYRQLNRGAAANQLFPGLRKATIQRARNKVLQAKPDSHTPCSSKACGNNCPGCKAKPPAKTEQELPRSAGCTDEIPCCKKSCQNCEHRAQESGK